MIAERIGGSKSGLNRFSLTPTHSFFSPRSDLTLVSLCTHQGSILGSDENDLLNSLSNGLPREWLICGMKGMNMIEFKADKVKVNGPKADNSYSVTFEVGEYERHNVKDLLGLEPEQVLTVKVEAE